MYQMNYIVKNTESNHYPDKLENERNGIYFKKSVFIKQLLYLSQLIKKKLANEWR